MDRSESVVLDWDAIEEEVMRYDAGEHNHITMRAKMLDIAFRDGYEQCEADHEQLMDNFNLMMTQPAGNA